MIVGQDTYLSVADCDAYWLARNNSVWAAANNETKEKSLLEATQYLDGAYEYIGELAQYDQPLAWPRGGAVITVGNLKNKFFLSTEIPKQIKDACAELALNGLSASLRPVQDRGNMIKREKVDVLEIEYSDFAPSQKTFDFVTLLLKGLTKGSSNQKTLIRV